MTPIAMMVIRAMAQKDGTYNTILHVPRGLKVDAGDMLYQADCREKVFRVLRPTGNPIEGYHVPPKDYFEYQIVYAGVPTRFGFYATPCTGGHYYHVAKDVAEQLFA